MFVVPLRCYTSGNKAYFLLRMTIRQQFPFFTQTDTVYLDTAATSQKPQSVIDALSTFYSCQNSNVHRGSYQSANQTTSLYEQTREDVARFINADAPENIIWTSGTTAAINKVCRSLSHAFDKDDVIVVLGSEHHANFVPWQQLAATKQLRFEVVNILANGDVDMTHFRQLMHLKPKLVCMQHCSNALGNIHPIERLVEEAKSSGAMTLVDGAQAVAHLSVDVLDIGCDFYVFSGHKMYAPTGIGVMYVSPNAAPKLLPSEFGGEMISVVTKQKTKFRPFPHFMETGTPNISGVIGLSAALEFIQSDEFQRAQKSEAKLYQYLLDKLSALPNVKLVGNRERNIGVASFYIDNESNADVGALLDQQGIAVRVGHHCAMPLMTALGLAGTIRASLGVYNSEIDVDRFIDALSKTIELLDI